MPSKSPAQARLMRAVAHGWKKPGGGGPSPSVAREFVDADKRANMYEGGLAPMTDIIQRGMAPGLNFQEGGEVEGLTFKQLYRQLGGNIGAALRISKGIEDGTYFHDKESGLIYPPQQTIVGDEGTAPSLTPDIRPGGAPGPVDYADLPILYGPRGGRGPGRGGRGGGGGRGGRRPPGQPPPGGDPGDRIIPPGRPPGGDLVPPGAEPYTPPDRRAGRDTPYSQALREHRARVAASLAVPPGGYAGGGAVRGYQEGGAVRPGHAEGPNPYPKDSARYRLWERNNHVDPPPPPPPSTTADPEEASWLDRLLGRGEDYVGRSERELEEMEEARGGYIHGYANGGLAQFTGPPRGGVPPRIKPQMPPMPYGGPMETTTGGPGSPDPRLSMPPQVNRQMPWRGAPPPRAMPGPGAGQMPGRGLPPGLQRKLRGMGMQPMGQPGNLRRPPMRPPPGVDPRGGPGVTPRDGGGMTGGPMAPPNLRGHMQRQRMMNRPRRGMPGPAGAGGAPNNRVGQSDQQGGLARALQRGTGRPPMSRRSGFYR